MSRPGVEIEGLDRVNRRLSRIARQLDNEVLKKGLQLTVLLVQSAIQEKLSGDVLNVGLGNLRRSIHTKVMVSGKHAIGIVGTPSKYALTHELGAIIRAKNKPYLHFRIHTSNQVFKKSGTGRLKKSKRGYTWVMVKQVKIPKRPFFRPSLKENENEIIGIFKRLLREHINQ